MCPFVFSGANMQAINTDTSIVSDACVIIGSEPINSFDEETVEAEAARAVYQTAYESLLRYRPWSFATKQIRPARLDLPITRQDRRLDSGYMFAYRIPGTVISILDLGSKPIDYRIFKTCFRRFYLRLPIVNVRGRYYGWLGFSFGSESTQPSSSHFLSLSLSLLRLFFVIATRWKEEREEEDVDDDEAPSARRL